MAVLFSNTAPPKSQRDHLFLISPENDFFLLFLLHTDTIHGLHDWILSLDTSDDAILGTYRETRPRWQSRL